MTHSAEDRAPFLTLWATVVARRLGYGEQEALTLGSAVASLAFPGKGRTRNGSTGSPSRLRKCPAPDGRGPLLQWTELMGRHVPTFLTESGLRAVNGSEQIDPDMVRRHLESVFEDHLALLEAKLTELASTYAPEVLAFVAMPLCNTAFRRRLPAESGGREHKGALYLRITEQLLAQRRHSR